MGKQKKELSWAEREKLLNGVSESLFGRKDTTQKTADSLKVSNTALKPTVEYDENIVPLDIETELTGEKTPTKRVQQYTQPTVPTPVNPMFMQLLQEEQKKQQLYQQTENQKQLQQLIDGIEGGKKNEGVVINRRPVYDLIPENRSGQEFITPTGEWQPTLEYQPREIQIGKLKGLQQKHDSGQPLTEEEDKMLKRLSVIQERKTLGNENRITDTAGSLTLQNIEPLISLFSGLHPATATVQGGGQLLRNIFNMDKQYNDGDAVRQGIDIALNTVGMGIQMIPKVAVISAIANNLKLFTGAAGKTTGAWGIKDQKNIDAFIHYATMIPFGARVTTALIMSEQGAEGLKSALDKNMIPGLEGIREDDKMRIVEGASHALFFASLYGAGKVGGKIKNKIDTAVNKTLSEDFPQVFQTQSPLGKIENVPLQDVGRFGKFENAYKKSGYKTEQEYLNQLDPAERTQFMEGWGKYKQAGKIDFWDYVDIVEGKKPFPEPQNKLMRPPPIDPKLNEMPETAPKTPPKTESMLKKIQDKKLTPKQLEVVQDYLLRKGVPQDLIDQARGQLSEKPKEQPKQVQTKEQVKNDNALQLEIMQKAGIPEAEMPDYALSSVADGKLLRSYITEVKSGELTVDEAVERVKTDYEKMKTGEKEGKFIEPVEEPTVKENLTAEPEPPKSGLQQKEEYTVRKDDLQFISTRQSFANLPKNQQSFILDKIKSKSDIIQLEKEENDLLKEIETRMGNKGNLPKPEKEFWEMTYHSFVNMMGGAGRHSDLNLRETHIQNVKQALSEGKPVPEEVLKDYPELRPKEEVKPEGIITDPVERQKKVESINEGMSILKYGKKINGKPYTPEELELIRRAVINAKKKIGDTSETPEVVYPKPKETPKTETKPGTINPRIKADDLEKLLSQKQKEMSPKEFFDYLDNVREKLVLTEQSKNDFPTVKRREVLRRFTQEATRQNPTEKDKIRKIADVAIANFIEQPGFSVVEFMTASARAVATKRLEQAGYKTTKMVEGEKTKFALKIEKPKQEATQTKPKEPELTEEQEDKILRKTEFADIINVPIKDIHIDLKRFQNRKSAYAEAIVKDIVDNFKPWSFKQITLWKDPKDGKDYVISGHSRLEGIIKRGDVDKIPSQYFPGTEAEARLYGKLEGNRENQNESLIEDVSAYKIAKESQLPKAELLRAFKTEGKINKLERLSYLDEKGEFLNNLDSEAAQSFPNIERNAGWVGELRKEYPVLTLAHENEIFDFFYRGKKENTLIRKEDFIDLVEKRISDGAFKSDQALLLDKVDNTGARGRADTREAQRQIDKLIENNKHYEALMKNADEAERDEYQAKLLRNLREIDRLKGGVDKALNSQMSLFQTSSQIFTRNFKNWFGDWENDPKNASRVVDAEGKPQVMYHGTNRTFDSFRDDRILYFSDNPEYAAMYGAGSAAKGAHYVGGKEKELENKTQAGANIYPVYIKATNIFDTTNPKHKAIFDREYYGKYGNKTPLDPEKQLPDWTDAEDLKEFFDDKGYNFDGIKLAESHGNTTIAVFSPSQIKSATGNKGTFSEFNNSILAQETKDLAALHNLTEDNLLHADKMGGLAMPSLAITRNELGLGKYGEITLIGDKDMVDPESGVKVFNRDAYSPTYPVIYRQVNRKALDKKISGIVENLPKELSKDLSNTGDRLIQDLSTGKYTAKDMHHNKLLRVGFLDSIGELPEPLMRNERLQHLPEFEGHYEAAQKLLSKYPQLKTPKEPTEEEISTESEKLLAKNKEYIERQRDPENALRSWAKSLIKEKNQEGYASEVKGFVKDYLNEFYKSLDKDIREGLKESFDSIANYHPGNLQNDLRRLLDPKKELNSYDYHYELVDPLIKKKQKEYEAFLEKEFGDVFGEEYLLKGSKKVPHSLSNVIDIMGTKIKGSEKTLVQGLGKSAAQSAKQFKSIEDMRKNKGRIVAENEFKEAEERLNNAFMELSDKVGRYYPTYGEFDFGRLDKLSLAIGKLSKGRQTDADVRRELSRAGYRGVPSIYYDNVKEVARMMKEMPTEYFEAKLERPVRLSEFNTAIVPETISPQAIKVLEDNGVKVVKYTDDADRKIKTRQAAERNKALFQSGDNPSGKPFSQLPKAEQEKLTKIITDRVIGLVIPDRTVKANANAITELVSEVVRFHPDRADEGTMWHEGTHLGLKSSTRPSEAKAILLQMRDSQGKRLWDGKGDPFDVANNPSLKEAHEQFAEDFETFLNDKKAFDEKYKTNPLRKRVAEVFERIKEIYRKIVNALKGEGFADAANWYRRFYEGGLKKEAEKRFREEDIKTEKDLVLAEKQQLFQITGEKGMQNYDKANNTHIVRNNLSVAKKMDEQKLSPEQIRLATGWEKGVEGKWRYEIPDVGIDVGKLQKSNEGGLFLYSVEVVEDITKAPLLSQYIKDSKNLLKAYPELEKTKLIMAISGFTSNTGKYSPEKNIIQVMAKTLRDAELILLHEIQHAIQNIEGFAFGGTPEMFKKQWRKENDLVEELNKQLSAASKSGDKKLYNELLDERAKVVKRIKELEDEYGIVGYKPYKRLAGEVEARNVQTRLRLTPEEKKAKTLQSTEDVPREDQIIRDSYGEASMASEPDPIGLNKAEIKELREELELDKLPKPERKRMEQSLNEAKLRGLKDTAMITADEVIRTKRVIDEAEHAGMVMKAKDLRDEINDIQRQVGTAVDAGDSLGIRRLIARRDDLIEQMDKLTMASDIAGTGIARALSIRRMRVEGANYDFASVMQRAKAQKGQRLTEKETARLTELTTKYEQAEEQLKTLHAEYDKMVEENEKLKAQKVTEAEVRKTSVERRASVQREKIVKEREDIKAQLRGLGFRVNDVAGLSAEGTYLIGKLALNYIKEGVVDLNEVVQKVMADVPDITERDVWRGINSKDPTRQVKAERETTKKVNQIKTQARLLEKIRLAEEGIFDKPRSKPQQDVEIKRLKDTLTSLRKEAFKSELEAKKLERALQTINELQDQLANMRRSIRKKQPEPTADLKAAKEKIKELRKIMRMDDQLADLNEQLRTKEFKIKEPRPTTPTTPEIDRKAVEIYTLKKKINEEVRKLRPLTIADYGMEVMNTLRTAKASMDMSAALRQAFFPSARRPLLAMQVQAKAIEAFFSQNAYDEIQYNIENHPNHYIRQMAKLEMTDIDSSPSHREEMFASTFAEKIPIYKHGILASNRHMVATLNLIRAGVFDEFLETYPNATMNELKAWADYVNVATGRGNLGKFTAAAQNLSYVLFSPRFAISRLQLPFMILKHWNEPRVRKEMAKDYAHFGGMAMTILGLAALAGLQVGTDPEDPNFGKIIVGNTKVDIFAGIQQPTRLLLRIGKTGTNRLGWTEASKREENPLEMIYRFGSYKLAPSVTVPVELMRGKSIIGEEREPTETLVNAVIPMVYEDIGDAYKDGGISKAAWSGSLNFFGMSTNTYEKKDATTVKTKGFEPRGRMYDRRGRTSVKRDYR